ncbi:MAG: transporter substrate-binding domain-containing protein [Sphaerochaetaceae bacterium]
MKKTIIIMLTVILAMSTVFAGGKKEEGFVFAADATWPPLEYIDESGNLVGFEVELVQEIGKTVGQAMVVKNIPWDTIFAGLANGAYDAVASGVTVTQERKATMDFSTPILSAGQVVIIAKQNEKLYSGIMDLKGKKVGVQIGTTGDFSLDTYPVVKKVYDDIGLAIEDMMNGNIDAAVCDSLIASDFVLANKNYQGKLVLAGEPFTQEDIAIAVKKGDSKLLGYINEGLAKMEANGSLATLKKKWNLF